MKNGWSEVEELESGIYQWNEKVKEVGDDCVSGILETLFLKEIGDTNNEDQLG